MLTMAANDTLSFIKALVDEHAGRQIAIDGIYTPALDIGGVFLASPSA
jgi:hypothetical protein